MIEVWRPGRPPGERRPRDAERRGRRRRHERAATPAERPGGEARRLPLATPAAARRRRTQGWRAQAASRTPAPPRSRPQGRGGTVAEATPPTARPLTASRDGKAADGEAGQQDRQARHSAETEIAPSARPARRDRAGRDRPDRGPTRGPRRDRDRDRGDDNRPSRTWSSDQPGAATRSRIRIRRSPSCWR